METVTIGELRQNPTPVIARVEAGATYRITRHGAEVGRLIPPGSSTVAAPPRRSGGATTSSLPRIGLTTADSVDALLESEKGEW